MARDLSMVEFDQWIVCPKCYTAMVGLVGEKCHCGATMVATPLMDLTDEDIPETPVSRNIVTRITRDRLKEDADDEESTAEIFNEYFPEYSAEELAVLSEYT